MLATLYAQAQTQDSTKKKDIDRLTWEIAYNALPLLNWKSNTSYLGLLTRKNIEKYSKGSLTPKYRAYRLMGGVYFYNNPRQFDNTKNFNDQESNTFDLNIQVGYEYQQVFNKWQFYYGYDFEYQLRYSKTTNYFSMQEQSTYKSFNNSLGIKPFLGFKYFISPRFSISTETALYSRATLINNMLEELPTKGRNYDVSRVEFFATFYYLNAIFASFHF